MARGRHRAAYFGTSQSRLYGFQRTKGHSILPQRSYGLLAGRGHYYSDDEYPVPGTYRPITSLYHGADYYMADAMTNHATNMSTDTVYDNIDLAAKSRGKDKRLMTQVNAALAYATPSTPARARASRRAERQQQPPAATTTSSAYNYYRVPYQVPFIAISPDRSRQRSLSPEYVYRRPVGGRARARAERRAVSVARDDVYLEPVRGREPKRASPVRYLPWYISPQREAELALSPTRLLNTRSRDTELDDYPYVRGFRFAYPYRTALWGRAGRRYPFYRGRFWGYPWGGSKLSGYPFGNTNWIVPPSTAASLGVTPVRAGREAIEPQLPSSWFWGPYDALDYEAPKARLRNWNWPLYDWRFNITPAEAIRFGVDPTTAAKWNAASPIRTGRWDMTPAEGMAWDAPEERIKWNVYPLRAGSPRARHRSLSPISSSTSQALSRSEAARWGITPSEASYWDMYPSSRKMSLDRYERARSLSPFRYDWDRSLSPFRYARARSLSPFRYDWAFEPEDRYRYFPRSRSLSPFAGYGVDPPYSIPRWRYPSIRPRDVTPLRFSPLPQRTRRHYASPRYVKKAIVPTKSARRAAARRYGYVPRPPVVFVYLDKERPGERKRSSSEGRTGRVSPGTVRQMLKRFEPRKPYEEEYSGKVAAARAIARAMTVIPQGIDYQAAIISPSVEIETKRKTKGPKSKYAAAVMRELRLNPKKDSGGKGSSEGGSGGATSALRQRLRKVVCKTRNDPTYYKD